MSRMNRLFFLIASSIIICSCGGHMHSSYQPKKYHQSIKHFNKIPDATTAKKGSKKKSDASSAKYKAKQASYLKGLNHGTKKNDGIFYMY